MPQSNLPPVEPADPGAQAAAVRPTVFTIAAGRAFVDVLAEGLLARHGADPMALSRVTVLLPNRRAVRALREAFLRAGAGRPMLLPALRPIGDIDEDEMLLAGAPEDAAGELDLPPAIGALERQLLLTRLLLARADLAPDPAGAVRLAADLGRFLDQVQAEDLTLERLDQLAPAEHAEHWQRTVAFLDILRRLWPAILAERAALDPGDRRNRLIRALAARWRAQAPADPIYAAGSTGSLPATAELLGVVARLPHGAVVLPGFAAEADDALDADILDDPAHPQHGMRRLLDRILVDRREVRDWAAPSPAPRRDLLRFALLPARHTVAWRHAPPPAPAAFQGLSRIEAPGPREEATAIALRLREALETPGKTAALVTPDRALAGRVAAELKRWGIAIDDSAGRPLALSPPATLLRALLAATASDLAPVPLLALLKHPLTAMGRARRDHLRLARRLDRRLRGPRPGPGPTGLIAAAGDDAELIAWIAELGGVLAPLLDPAAASLQRLLSATVAAGEALAADAASDGAARLWAGEDGEALRRFVQEALAASPCLPDLDPADWPPLFDALLAGKVVRPAWGAHPRLFIWGQLEARLQQADLLILGGLNEGTWPAEAEPDPWLSRPMRAAFGLGPPERRIGLAAHDFAQAAAAPEVVLTRALKVGGAQTVPSRWLLRLQALLDRVAAWRDARDTAALHWAEAIDRPDQVEPCPPPKPAPPVALRPRALSATRIERLIRDPYAIFAQYVLELYPWEGLDLDPGAAERGTAFHEALDGWLKDHPGPLPPDAVDRLIDHGERALAPVLARPAVRAFWLPRFRRIAAWFVDFETRRRKAATTMATEIKGTLSFAAAAGPFVLSATADRIDRLQDGSLSIVDYKTGQPPGRREVLELFAPQLPLEAAIAKAGGFPGLPPARIGELLILRLSGGEPAGEEKIYLPKTGEATLDAIADEALSQLKGLIAKFDHATQPYLSQIRPKTVGAAGDYDHLARVAEWRTAPPAGGEE